MLLETTRRYIARGFSVVPIPARQKGPTYKGWPELRITDPIGWFDESSNVGIILGPASGMVCVDLDHPLAVDLAESFLPPTGMVAGRGERPRCHWFYRVTGPIENKKHKHKRQTICEILGEGNQVVAGPSIHPSGDRYDIVDGEPATVDGHELEAAVYALFCAVLAELGESMPTMTGNGKPTGTASTPTDGAPGTDYDQRGDVRSLLVKHGWTPLFMSGDNEHWRRPGKAWGSSATLRDCKLFYCFTSSTELEAYRCYGPFGLYAKLEHGGDYRAAADELRRQGYGSELPDVNLSAITSQDIASQTITSQPKPDDDDEDPEPLDDFGGLVGEFPPECLRPPGLLGDLVDHCLATSRYPQPELALAAALAMVGTITGRKVTDEFGTRTNVYVLGLDETGTGKEHARQVNKELLVRAGVEKMHGSERVGSHAGIVNAVHESPAILMQLDEIGRLLATMKDPRKAPHLYNCITVLMQLYSSSATIWKADAYADSKKVKVIDQPHLCVYGTATPDSFWHNLSTENIAEGLVGRLMVFEGRGYSVDMQKPARAELPKDLIDAARWWLEYRPAGGNLGGDEHPKPSVVPHDPAAERRFMGHIAAINAKRKTESKLRAALWSRSGEKTAKLALIHACSRSRTLPIAIELADVEFGIQLANWVTRRILASCGDHVSENEHEAKVKRLLSIVGNGRITMNQLTRKTQWLKGRERLEIVRDLIGCGLLNSEIIATKGRQKTVLFRQKTALRKG
jgi:hypothetical protein